MNTTKDHGFDHVGHCLDHLRQGVQCHVDVTPDIWIWNTTLKANRPRLDTMHTCRNYDLVRDWAREHNLKGMQWSVHAKDDL